MFKASSNLVDAITPGSADSIAATTTETAFVTDLDIPQSDLGLDQRLRYVAKLKGTSSSGTPPTVALALKSGTVTLATVTLTFAADQTNVPITVVADLAVKDVGDEEEEEDASIFAGIQVTSAGFTAKQHTANPAAVTHDAIGEDGISLELTADWSAATGGNSLALLDAYIERL
jgi:hypothetical protein